MKQNFVRFNREFDELEENFPKVQGKYSNKEKTEFILRIFY